MERRARGDKLAQPHSSDDLYRFALHRFSLCRPHLSGLFHSIQIRVSLCLLERIGQI